MSNILPILPEEHWIDLLPLMKNRVRNPFPKLALFSGHDKPILALLATLVPKSVENDEWVPYASMFIIEVHDIQTVNDYFPSGKAFRLLYNGSVLTDKVDGCMDTMELCDITILVQRIGQFTFADSECYSLPTKSNLR